MPVHAAFHAPKLHVAKPSLHTVRKPAEHEPRPGLTAHDEQSPVIAACLVIIARSTHRALFIRRGPDGDYPGTWCSPGGKVEDDEEPVEAAVREAEEEVGYEQQTTPVFLAHVYSAEVDLTIFAAEVNDEFQPKLNDESTGFAWAPINAPPQPQRMSDFVDVVVPELKARMGIELAADERPDAPENSPLERPYRAIIDYPEAHDEFKEDEHPRDEHGQFTSGGGSFTSASAPSTPPAYAVKAGLAKQAKKLGFKNQSFSTTGKIKYEHENGSVLIVEPPKSGEAESSSYTFTGPDGQSIKGTTGLRGNSFAEKVGAALAGNAPDKPKKKAEGGKQKPPAHTPPTRDQIVENIAILQNKIDGGKFDANMTKAFKRAIASYKRELTEIDKEAKRQEDYDKAERDQYGQTREQARSMFLAGIADALSSVGVAASNMPSVEKALAKYERGEITAEKLQGWVSLATQYTGSLKRWLQGRNDAGHYDQNPEYGMVKELVANADALNKATAEGDKTKIHAALGTFKDSLEGVNQSRVRDANELRNDIDDAIERAEAKKGDALSKDEEEKIVNEVADRFDAHNQEATKRQKEFDRRALSGKWKAAVKRAHDEWHGNELDPEFDDEAPASGSFVDLGNNGKQGYGSFVRAA